MLLLNGLKCSLNLKLVFEYFLYFNIEQVNIRLYHWRFNHLRFNHWSIESWRFATIGLMKKLALTLWTSHIEGTRLQEPRNINWLRLESPWMLVLAISLTTINIKATLFLVRMAKFTIRSFFTCISLETVS